MLLSTRTLGDPVSSVFAGLSTIEGRLNAVKWMCEHVWRTGRHSLDLCPADSDLVGDFWTSITKSDSKYIKRAIPISYPMLEMERSYMCGARGLLEYGMDFIIWWNAFTSTSFALWTRIDELLDLKWSQVTATSKDGSDIVEVILTWRKTNQTDPTKGNRYYIPSRAEEEPASDMFKYLLEWRDHVGSINQTLLAPDAFVFPKIAADGIVQWGVKMDQKDVITHMNNIYFAAGMIKEKGTLTSHGYRRGAAQHR